MLTRLPSLQHLCRWFMLATVCVATATTGLAVSPPTNVVATMLTASQANDFAKLVLASLDCEFPHKPGVVFNSVEQVQRPQALHPAFFGSFDWHSSVHGHWLLVRLLRLYPDMPLAQEIRKRLAAHLDSTSVASEAAVFDRKGNKSFERMYGWAWALRLAAELRTFDDPEARRWATQFTPLEQKLVAAVKEYLPKLTYPVRTGVHPDTGFALGQILDYARLTGDNELAALVTSRALAYYAKDNNYPVAYEPSGEDFFSSGLNEADLMRRVLSPKAFSEWLDGFWPGLQRGDLNSWGKPAEVSDLSDPKIVHLVGLNLSRAWTMRGIASVLPEKDPRRARLATASAAHAEAGLKYVFSGHYEGEHWLGTFAVYHLTDAGLIKARDK